MSNRSAAQNGRDRFRAAIKLSGLTLLHLKCRNMAPTLGKRKRRDQTDDLGNISGLVRDDTNTNQLQALFRQHFESTFEPLEALASQSRKPKNHETAECLAGSNSDWDGFSVSEDDEDASPALVVQCSTHRSSRADIPKEEVKAFMVGVLQVHRLLRAD